MESIVININIICGDIIGSAVIQGDNGNTVDYNLPELTPAVVDALRVVLGRDGDGET